MRKVNLWMIVSITLLIATVANAQPSFKTVEKDFETLSGTWQGSLTYLDYSSGLPYTMPADLEIKRIPTTNQFIISNIYPNEVSANSTDTVSISTDGKYIDKELIKSRRKLTTGDIEIITEEAGKDGNDNTPAVFRHTYTFGATTYKIRKDVQYTGKTEWIKRHEYVYKKKLSK